MNHSQSTSTLGPWSAILAPDSCDASRRGSRCAGGPGFQGAVCTRHSCGKEDIDGQSQLKVVACEIWCCQDFATILLSFVGGRIFHRLFQRKAGVSRIFGGIPFTACESLRTFIKVSRCVPKVYLTAGNMVIWCMMEPVHLVHRQFEIWPSMRFNHCVSQKTEPVDLGNWTQKKLHPGFHSHGTAFVAWMIRYGLLHLLL